MHFIYAVSWVKEAGIQHLPPNWRDPILSVSYMKPALLVPTQLKDEKMHEKAQ